MAFGLLGEAFERVEREAGISNAIGKQETEPSGTDGAQVNRPSCDGGRLRSNEPQAKYLF